jgi:phosphate-selective porin OprO/OprP
LVLGIGSKDVANLYGIIILPTYRLTERIELVLRYQYLVSDASDGVQLQRRYERRAPELPTSWGNNYQALYAGVNYYLYRNRMKLMAGLEYSHMDLGTSNSYNQITLFSGFRVWF